MYRFRKDSGEVIEVDFETAMNARDGILELEDGSLARRVREPSSRSQSDRVQESKRIISDAMGFGQHQLRDMEADRIANGHVGVEFRPDPAVPEFYQVHCSSESAKRKYMEHRGLWDKNSKNGSGAILSPEQHAQAVDRVIQEYGSFDNVSVEMSAHNDILKF